VGDAPLPGARKECSLEQEYADRASIAEEFPGWEAWRSFNGMWHGRKLGSVPPVMFHGESSEQIREQISVAVAREG
jgi:hypothetical protein